MDINSVSSQAFGARFATLGEREYTPRQKALIRSVVQDLNDNNSGNDTAVLLEDIADDCYIFAKPVGKTGVVFQANISDYNDLAEWTSWYDKLGPDSKKYSTVVVQNKNDAISAFDSLVADLHSVDEDDLLTTWDVMKDDKKSTMQHPPRRINLLW